MVNSSPYLRWKWRVMITASRLMTRDDVVELWMDRVLDRAREEGFPPEQILWAVGDCPTGGDKFAWKWLKAHNAFFQRYEADWDRHGSKLGGPMRNNLMISEIRPTHTLAFLRPESKGTVGCSDRAQKISEVTRIYSPTKWITHKAGTPVPGPFDWSTISETL